MVNSHRLGRRVVTDGGMPYVIAEIGVNHGGSLDLAKKLIDQAKDGGADAVKFQSYKAHTLASKVSPSYWDTSKEPTTSQFALFKKYDSFDEQDYRELSVYCCHKEVDFVSTPFDDAAIEYLDPLVPFYKIASADLTNIPFLRKVAQKGKPVVLSTGASTLAEIDMAVEALKQAGCENVVLLHCVLNYPTANRDANLGMIRGLKRSYPEHIIGYSDHTMPDEAMTPLMTAHALGATVIEKHFTHDKDLPGNDHYHAMDMHDLRRFVDLAQNFHVLVGDVFHKAPLKSETVSRRNARRSIVLARDVASGQQLSTDDLTYKRPGSGISPLHWDEVIGRYTSHQLEPDHILQWEDLKPE